MIEPQANILRAAIVEALEAISEPAYWTGVRSVLTGRAGQRLTSAQYALPALFVSVDADQIEEPRPWSQQQSQHMLSVMVEMVINVTDDYEGKLIRLAQDVRRALQLRTAQRPVGGAASSVEFPEPMTIYAPEGSAETVRAEFPMSFRYLESTADG